MKSSEMEFQEDLFANYGHGYDGRLEQFDLSVANDRLSATAVLLLVRGRYTKLTQHRATIRMTDLKSVRIDAEWFVGGGQVLYDGARLLTLSTGELVLDLDPGVAWLTTSRTPHDSQFLLRGFGESVFSSVPSELKDSVR